jgi:nucleoside-diphosphate-sugar epimerase
MRLLERGHQVTATTRTPCRLPWLRAFGAEAMLLDGLDPVAVGEVVGRAEPDVIVHEMTALGVRPDLRHFDRWYARTNDLRTAGTDYLLSAAHAAGVRRFVVQSYTGWTNARIGAVIKTEQHPPERSPATTQRASLAAILSLEKSVMEAPLHGVVLRYGNVYGAEGDVLVERIRRRRLPVVGHGDGVWSWVHVDDAAAATVAAIERAARGTYNVVDDEPAPVAQWLPYLAEALGAKEPVRVPTWLGRRLLGEATTRWLTEARGSSNVLAKRELDWRPAWVSWRDGFVHALDDRPARRYGIASLPRNVDRRHCRACCGVLR